MKNTRILHQITVRAGKSSRFARITPGPPSRAKGGIIAASLIAGFSVFGPGAMAGDEWSIPWHSIDGGGELFAQGGEYELSGTIGQWDATEARALVGGQWQLTGGFWGLSLEELADLLFSDRFEEEQ